MSSAPRDQSEPIAETLSANDLEREMQDLLAQSEESHVQELEAAAVSAEQLDELLAQSPHSAELDSILSGSEDEEPAHHFEPSSPEVVTDGHVANAAHEESVTTEAEGTHAVAGSIQPESGINELIASVEKTLEEQSVPLAQQAGAPTTTSASDTEPAPVEVMQGSEPELGTTVTAQAAVPATIESLDANLARDAEAELSKKPVVEAEPEASGATAAAAFVKARPAPGNKAQPPARAPGVSQSHESKPAPRAKKPSWLMTVLDPALRRTAAKASAPLASRAPAVRRVVGYVSVNTLLMGACLWGYVLFVRPQQLATAQAQPFNFETSGLPAPAGSHDEHGGGHDEGHQPASSGHGGAKSGGHGSEKKSGGGHGSEKKSGGGHGGGGEAKARSDKPLLSSGSPFLINDKLSAKKEKPKEAKGGGGH